MWENKYVYISGLEIFELKTTDITVEYISIMVNNMCPCTIAFGVEYT